MLRLAAHTDQQGRVILGPERGLPPRVTITIGVWLVVAVPVLILMFVLINGPIATALGMLIAALCLGGIILPPVLIRRAERRRGPVLIYDPPRHRFELPRLNRWIDAAEVHGLGEVEGWFLLQSAGSQKYGRGRQLFLILGEQQDEQVLLWTECFGLSKRTRDALERDMRLAVSDYALPRSERVEVRGIVSAI